MKEGFIAHKGGKLLDQNISGACGSRPLRINKNGYVRALFSTDVNLPSA